MGNYTFFICSKILVEAGNQEQMLRKTQISNGLTNRYFPKIHVGCPWYPYSNIILEWGRLLTKRHSKGGGGDESPLFTVETTLNLTYQPVMQQFYKPGKILSNAWSGERATHLESFRPRHEVPRRKKSLCIICQPLLFVRSHYLQRFFGSLDNILGL